MRAIDLSKYEEVKDRIPKFYEKYSDGRIITQMIEGNEDKAVFVTKLFKNADEQVQDTPLATGYAFEFRDKVLRKKKDGSTYETVNFSKWVENCETSSIGRALANRNISGSKERPSREEMESVNYHKPNVSTEPTQSQRKAFFAISKAKGFEVVGDVVTIEEKPINWKKWTKQEMSRFIDTYGLKKSAEEKELDEAFGENE